MLIVEISIQTQIGKEGIKDGNGNNFESPVFYLEYLNSDDIPEMIIKTEEGISDYYILMYQNGEVKENYIPCNEYINVVSGNSIVSAYIPHFVGYSHITYLLNEEGTLETVCEYIETYTEESISEANPLVRYFYVNSEEVSEARYQEFLENLLGEDKTVITIGGVEENENYYPCDEEYLEKLCCGELK